MKPHSSAKESTSSVESILNSLERTLKPCKMKARAGQFSQVGIRERQSDQDDTVIQVQ